MSHAAYRLQNIRKSHGDAFTLEVDDLEIVRGEALCLIGPTGAGKSTLLRLLSLIDSPSSGRLVFAGVAGAPPWPLDLARQVAAVPQRPAMLSSSVRYNIEFGLRVRGERRPGVRVERMLDLLRLDSLADHDARRLSGGQAQLVAIARALVVESGVLLLDEPTANLDPAHVGLVEDVVEEQRVRTGATVVWITHNLFQARRRGTRTGLLLEGKLVEIAATDSLFDNPADPRTRDFIQGDMVY